MLKNKKVVNGSRSTDNKLQDFIRSEFVGNRIRNEIISRKDSVYLNVIVDKNSDGDYVLCDTLCSKLDRRKLRWAGKYVDQRMVFLFKIHDLSTDMAYKGYFDTPENILSKYSDDEYRL